MPANVFPPRFRMLARPTGAAYNLVCSYFFFLDKDLLHPNSKFRMAEEVLEFYIPQSIASHRSREVSVAWQDGKPTLMGVDFYRKAMQFQEKYRRPGMSFENTLLNNGTLLVDESCEFLKENIFWQSIRRNYRKPSYIPNPVGSVRVAAA
jgi:uncharacterized protein